MGDEPEVEAERLRQELETERRAWARLERQLRAEGGGTDQMMGRLVEEGSEVGVLSVGASSSGSLEQIFLKLTNTQRN